MPMFPSGKSTFIILSLNNATTEKTPTNIINIIKAAFGAFESVFIVVDVSVVVRSLSRVFTAILSFFLHEAKETPSSSALLFKKE
jgi:hypothetical protein